MINLSVYSAPVGPDPNNDVTPLMVLEVWVLKKVYSHYVHRVHRGGVQKQNYQTFCQILQIS